MEGGREWMGGGPRGPCASVGVCRLPLEASRQRHRLNGPFSRRRVGEGTRMYDGGSVRR